MKWKRNVNTQQQLIPLRGIYTSDRAVHFRFDLGFCCHSSMDNSSVAGVWLFKIKFTLLMFRILASSHRTAHIRHLCRKRTVSSCHRCLINIGVEKNEQHWSIDYSFDHQMSPGKRKRWYSNNCLHFLKRAVLLLMPVEPVPLWN